MHSLEIFLIHDAFYTRNGETWWMRFLDSLKPVTGQKLDEWKQDGSSSTELLLQIAWADLTFLAPRIFSLRDC